MKKICAVIVTIIGFLVVITFLFLILFLIASNELGSVLIRHFFPEIPPIIVSTTPINAGDLVLKHACFMLQFVTWIFTLVAFAFTALGFFGMRRMASLRKAEDDIRQKFEALQKEHDALKKREADEFEFTTARIFYFQDLYTDALERLERLSSVNNPEVDLYKGFALTKMGDNQRALASFENALKAPNVDKARVYYNIGLCWVRCKVFDKAIDYFDRAISEKGSLVDAYIDKAVALRRSGNLQKAIEVLKNVILLAPKNSRANYNLACYFALLNDESWERHLSLVVEINALKYIKQASADTDFISVNESEKFKNILQKGRAK